MEQSTKFEYKALKWYFVVDDGCFWDRQHGDWIHELLPDCMYEKEKDAERDVVDIGGVICAAEFVLQIF